MPIDDPTTMARMESLSILMSGRCSRGNRVWDYLLNAVNTLNLIEEMGNCLNPRKRRQVFSAHCSRLNIMCHNPSRVRQPCVRDVDAELSQRWIQLNSSCIGSASAEPETHRMSATPPDLSSSTRWPSDTWPQRVAERRQRFGRRQRAPPQGLSSYASGIGILLLCSPEYEEKIPAEPDSSKHRVYEGKKGSKPQGGRKVRRDVGLTNTLIFHNH